MVLLSASNTPTEFFFAERGPLVSDKIGLEVGWVCQVDNSEDVCLTVFARSIDLEQQNLLAMSMGEKSRLTAYRFLNVLFPSTRNSFRKEFLVEVLPKPYLAKSLAGQVRTKGCWTHLKGGFQVYMRGP
jgi:hypothetical protein